jgi:hypothetical protein
MVKPLEHIFPGSAKGGYQVTSPPSNSYNCIAYAAGDTAKWWWPADEKEAFWPEGVTRAETLAAFTAAFASLGYLECRAAELEAGFEKVALFANHQGLPLHAARQRPDGRWTSKLGEREDIEHALHDLEGETYGTVVLLMKRPLQPVEKAAAT